MNQMKMYYFGCVGKSGHYMFQPSDSYPKQDHTFTRDNPWGYQVDSGLCPSGPQVEGRAMIHHKDGWTALSFWDRSVDRRSGSNSNFLAEGTFTFAEMVEFAKERFPKIMARFAFTISSAA
jgi:hypothetical protein